MSLLKHKHKPLIRGWLSQVQHKMAIKDLVKFCPKNVRNSARLRHVKTLYLVLLLSSCANTPTKHSALAASQTTEVAALEGTEACPPRRVAKLPLQNIHSKELKPDTWLSDTQPQLDDIVMSQDAIARHNARIYNPLYDISHPIDKRQIREEVLERMASFERKFAQNELIVEDGSTLPKGWFLASVDGLFSKDFTPRIHIALAQRMIHCAADTRNYIKSIDGDARFSRNHCSILRAQEPLEILSDAIDGFYFVRSGYVWGFIRSDTPLSPALSKDEAASLAKRSARYMLNQKIEWQTQTLDKGAFIAGDSEHVYLASEEGIHQVALSHFLDQKGLGSSESMLIDSQRALTRRAWIETAFLFSRRPLWLGRSCRLARLFEAHF